MAYNPAKHHRRSIRLKGYDYSSPGAYFITICTHQRDCLFGEIVDDEMQLNRLGEVMRSHWINLPHHHRHLKLDAFVVTPNHVHGILVLCDRAVGAGFADDLSVLSKDGSAKPDPTRNLTTQPDRGIPEILRGFKTFSSRRINQIRQMTGVPVWQRNYYEHIIRDEAALQKIREYIQTNPLLWQIDQLHPAYPSKW